MGFFARYPILAKQFEALCQTRRDEIDYRNVIAIVLEIIWILLYHGIFAGYVSYAHHSRFSGAETELQSFLVSGIPIFFIIVNYYLWNSCIKREQRKLEPKFESIDEIEAATKELSEEADAFEIEEASEEADT